MYFLRDHEDSKTIELHRYRTATELGFAGLIGPLPEFMAGQVRAWRELELEALEVDGCTHDARIGFTLRDAEPVLIMRVVPDFPHASNGRVGTLIFRAGPMAKHADFRTRLDSHIDPADWARQVIGVEHISTGFLASWLGTRVHPYTGHYAGGEFDDFLTELRRREMLEFETAPASKRDAMLLEAREAQDVLLRLGFDGNRVLPLPLLEPDVEEPVAGRRYVDVVGGRTVPATFVDVATGRSWPA